MELMRVSGIYMFWGCVTGGAYPDFPCAPHGPKNKGN